MKPTVLPPIRGIEPQRQSPEEFVSRLRTGKGQSMCFLPRDESKTIEIELVGPAHLSAGRRRSIWNFADAEGRRYQLRLNLSPRRTGITRRLRHHQRFAQ